MVVGDWRQILGGCGWLSSNLGWLWMVVGGCRWLHCLVQPVVENWRAETHMFSISALLKSVNSDEQNGS